MARIATPALEAMSADQIRVHDQIAQGPRSGVRGPLAIWLHRPDMAERAAAFGAYCRYETLLPRRLSELAILVVASHWRSAFEWNGHAPLALAAGLACEAVECIRRGENPRFSDASEAAVHAFAREICETREVDDTTWDATVAAIGKDGVVDLLGVLGYYTLISLTINACRIERQPGTDEPFHNRS